MKPAWLKFSAIFVLLTGLLMLTPAGGALAQTYLTDAVTAADPDAKELFQISNPAASTGTDKVIVAKFVVDKNPNDLTFRLETTDINKYPPKDFKISDGNVVLTDADTGETVATLRLRDLSATEPASPGYWIIKISLRYENNYVFAAADNWKLRIKQPAAGTTHLWGFWHSGTGEATVEAAVTQPKLINFLEDAQLTNFGAYSNFTSPKNLSFGGVHINLADEYLPDEMFQFRNVGTKTLTITAANPSTMPSSAYNVENYPSPPLTVLPMAGFSRRVTCKPTTPGAIPDVNITLTTDAPTVGTAGALALNLVNSRGIRLNSAILFDLSGSMLQDKNGLPNSSPWEAAPDQQKVYLARLAALELADLYALILPDARLGLYTYPNLNGDCPSSQEIISLNEIKNNLQSFKNRLDAGLANPGLIKPQSAYAQTPMAEGIARVYNVLPRGQADQRHAVFHFGDGQHNCDSSGAKKTPADWYNDSSFRTAGIPFFTIPYGAVGAGWLQTFASLAQRTNGTMFPADITDDLELQKEFKKALGKALDLETLKDPKAQVTAGSTKSHAVCVTASSQQLVFTVHWGVRNPNALTVTVETPDHQLLTPAAAAGSKHVSYVSGLNYAAYVVRGDYLRGGNGSGQWRLHVRGNITTPYLYQVYAQDTMKARATFDLKYIGELARLAVQVDGYPPLMAVQAKVSYNIPTASMNTFLATTSVEPKLILEAPKELAGRPLSLAERKIYALTRFMKKPLPLERRDIEELVLPGAPSPARLGAVELIKPANAAVKVAAPPAPLVMQTALKETAFDGLYAVNIAIAGQTLWGECFEREFNIAKWADILLTKDLLRRALTWQEVRVTPFFDPKLAETLKSPVPTGMVRKSIVFTPRDAAGNYFGIGRAAEIGLTVQNAKVLGPMVDNLDGSYIQVVEYKQGEVPNVAVTVGGETAGLEPGPAETPGEANWWYWIIMILILVALLAALRRKFFS